MSAPPPETYQQLMVLFALEKQCHIPVLTSERHLYELKSAHQYIRVVAHWPPRDPNGHEC